MVLRSSRKSPLKKITMAKVLRLHRCIRKYMRFFIPEIFQFLHKTSVCFTWQRITDLNFLYFFISLRRQISSQLLSVSHVGAGLASLFSRPTPPVRKNMNSSLSSSFLDLSKTVKKQVKIMSSSRSQQSLQIYLSLYKYFTVINNFSHSFFTCFWFIYKDLTILI